MQQVCVIGAGPIGLAFACCLAQGTVRCKVKVLEKRAEEEIRSPQCDGRDIALTQASKEILEALGVWREISGRDIAPIREARVYNDGNEGVLRFSPHRTSDLGFLVPNRVLRRVLYREALKRDNIEICSGTSVGEVRTDEKEACVFIDGERDPLRSALLVAADSRFSPARQQMGIPVAMKHFGRVMVVCRLNHEKEHGNIAYEFFQRQGLTLALLPCRGKQSSAIITVDTEEADFVKTMPEAEMGVYLQEKFQHFLGAMTLEGKRYTYSLVGVYAKRFVKRRFALIGDAAVSLHPGTAHGFNLGLRGAHSLAQTVLKAHDMGEDIASPLFLKQYQTHHARFAWPLYCATNAFIGLYTSDHAVALRARALFLRAANACTPIKSKIVDFLTDV